MKVLIADDEDVARRRLVRLLSQWSDVTLCGECQTGEEVLRVVAETHVDIILLDVQMPGLTGLDAKALMPAGGPRVIFCTAHAEHAVRAFDVGAADYLLKPVEPERLRKALDRAIEGQRALGPRGVEVSPLERLALTTRQGIVLIPPEEVTHAVVEGELVRVHTASAKHLTELSLQELADRLPRGVFERVHRRALVNLARVERLEPNEVGGFVAHLSGGPTVEVSRAAARELRRRLGLRRAAGDEPHEG